jgi:hypothetical protein
MPKKSPRSREAVVRALLTKINVDETNGCWRWTGGLSTQYAYPTTWCEGTAVGVHRLLYEAKHGELPKVASDGSRLEVHHDRINTGCLGRAGHCVSPDHMIAISAKQHGSITALERALGLQEPRPPRRSRKKPSASTCVEILPTQQASLA